MMALEKMKGFARTVALKDRRSGNALSRSEFEDALNAYASIDALTKGEEPLPVPPLFLQAALAAYDAVRWRYRRAA